MSVSIRPLTEPDFSLYAEHLKRHYAESGRDGDPIFMPYVPAGDVRLEGVNQAALLQDLSEVRWQRCWIAHTEDRGIVGHVELKGDVLHTGLHRCELGIGVERAYRRCGCGRQLMNIAIEFARSVDSIEWVDLRVFAHNLVARELYQSLGFTEVGTISDRFRIDGVSVDDVLMTLQVA